ncbi:divalent-cation tolerance protein CutA [Rubritalea profundi]|uniref:Divalent-cation tolerance protein CutA n=1 Tax=Rubritalea profundi TaxID=1658618 RepID=A0A2S7U6Q9_9BACT|nr:divalent-cation tolerance protein CutA [Rubritalea profundi]PQJ29903.1 divalent-cation tolerance protein CutA [Rubritalea profundi]
MEVILVYINFPNRESARQIGTGLIEKQLAACVNIIPEVESIYQWKGEVKVENEVMVIVKTTASRYKQLEAFVLEKHPYDVPEVISLPLSQGSESYLNWVQDKMEGYH